MNEFQQQVWDAAQGQLDAYNARSIDDFVKWYTHDIELITLEDNNVFCRGIEELRQRYAPMFEKNTSLHCSLLSRVVCGKFCFDEESVTGIVPDTIVHAVAIYEVNDGLIRKAWFVRNTIPSSV
jgi:hypothetical protein